MEAFADKSAARAAARRLRQGWSEEERRRLGEGMARQLAGWEVWRRAGTVFCFYGAAREPDTRPVLALALAAGKRLCLPRVTGPGRMEAAPAGDLAALAPGAFGIPEPSAGTPPADPAELDLILLPCLAAAPDGVRLGWGGGYYDRFLAGFAGPAAVLCPEALVAPQLPAEPHDAPVGWIVTERRVLPCRKEE